MTPQHSHAGASAPRRPSAPHRPRCRVRRRAALVATHREQRGAEHGPRSGQSGGPLAGIKVAAAAPNPTALDSDNPTPGSPRPIDNGTIARIEKLAHVASVVPDPREPGSGPAATRAPSREPPRRWADLRQPGGRRSPSGRRPPHHPAQWSPARPDFHRRGRGNARLPQPNRRDVRERTIRCRHRNHVRRTPRFTFGHEHRIRARWSRAQIVGVVSQDAGNGLVVAPIGVARTGRGVDSRAEPALTSVAPPRRIQRSSSSPAGSNMSLTYGARLTPSASRRARPRH